MSYISFWQVIELPQETIWLHDGRCHGALPVHVFICFNVRPFWASLTWAKLYCYVHTGITIFFCIISLEQTICSPSCPTTKYMTLVLKFFCCNKMTITRRRSNLFPKFRKIPAALDEYFAMAVSNRDLKPFWDFLWKFACDLGFASYLKFKIIKVRIEVKLLKIYFVVRPCKPTKN